MSNKVLKAKEKHFGKPLDNCVDCRFWRRSYTNIPFCAAYYRELLWDGTRPRWCRSVNPEVAKDEPEAGDVAL